MMKGLTLIFLLCAALLLAACGSSNNTATTVGNTVAGGNTATKTEKTETQPGESMTTTGVASCDELLAKVENCMNSSKVPEAARTTYKQTYEQYRNLTRQGASTPEGKAALETNCKAALDAARASLDTCK